MKVLHVGKSFPPAAGGIESFLRDLMLAQQAAGTQAEAIVHHHETGRPTVQENVQGLAVTRVRVLGDLVHTPISPTFPRHLAATIRRLKPDVLHLHMPNVSAFWTLLHPTARRIPAVVHWHADVLRSKLDRGLAMSYWAYRPFEGRLLRHSRAIIATSPRYADSSPTLQPFRDKLHTVPIGIDRERLAEPDPSQHAWAESTWPGDGLRVLVIGRLAYYKGHRVLFEAVQHCERPLALCIVGDGPLKDALHADLRQHTNHDQILMLGGRTDEQVRALLHTCDCLCLPSIERTEAFGVVLLEAMGYGKPTIASDVPGSGMGWVIRDGQTGLLVPPSEPRRLADALQTLAADPSLCARLGEQGRSDLAARFDIHRIAEQLEAVYKGVV